MEEIKESDVEYQLTINGNVNSYGNLDEIFIILKSKDFYYCSIRKISKSMRKMVEERETKQRVIKK